MKECEIEEYLREQVKEQGGRAFKFVSPGNDGVPDRIVVLPGGHVIFVETKAPGQKPTALQNLQINRLQSMGCTVYVIDSKSMVDAFIKVCEGLMA